MVRAGPMGQNQLPPMGCANTKIVKPLSGRNILFFWGRVRADPRRQDQLVPMGCAPQKLPSKRPSPRSPLLLNSKNHYTPSERPPPGFRRYLPRLCDDIRNSLPLCCWPILFPGADPSSSDDDKDDAMKPEWVVRVAKFVRRVVHMQKIVRTQKSQKL